MSFSELDIKPDTGWCSLTSSVYIKLPAETKAAKDIKLSAHLFTPDLPLPAPSFSAHEQVCLEVDFLEAGDTNECQMSQFKQKVRTKDT